MSDRAEQAGGETGSEEHEDRDPVRRRGEEDRAEDREGDHDHHAPGELDARRERGRGRPAPGDVDDRHRDPVHGQHVDDTDHGGAEEAREQQGRPADGANHERLQQAALRVARDDSQREEDRKHDPEEEGREHREPEQEGTSVGARVDVEVRRRRDRGETREHVVSGEPEEDEERRCQQDDDGEHLAPHGFPEAVAHDRQHAAQETSSPTASRYVSSSVDVRARTP